jgi:hypothetical protein
MRLVCAVVSSLLFATPAFADPFSFTFSGVTGTVAQLTRADGTVLDVGLTRFTVTGVVTGIDPFWEALSNESYKDSVSPFLATTTYDFGGARTFTMQGDHYVESYLPLADGLGRDLVRIGVWSWFPGAEIDQNGFSIGLDPIVALPASDAPAPLDIGAVVPLNTIANFRNLQNAAGDRLSFGLNGLEGQQMLRITAATASTPEPASGLLLLIGGAAVAVFKRTTRAVCV